jgi:hypothetical protein
MAKSSSKTIGKSSFGALQKRYNLPSEQILAAFFDVEPFSKEQDPIKEILKKVAERLDMISSNLEGFISPEHFAGMQEVDRMPEQTKADALALYRKVMFTFRGSQILLFDYNQEKSAEFVSELCTSYPQLQKQLCAILASARDSWQDKKQLPARKTESPDRNQTGYFG